MAGGRSCDKAPRAANSELRKMMGKDERLKSQQLRSCVLILGAHGSGASALADVLSTLGCVPPASVRPASKGNEQSVECSNMRLFNEELLASAGSAWDDIGKFPVEWRQSPPAAGFAERAVSLLGQEFGDAPLTLLEDPRICRFAGFWIEALQRFGCTVRPVLMVRNPLALASSDCSVPLSQMLWLRHMLDAEQATRGLARAHTSFEQLIAGWDGVTRKAQDSLEITWPKSVASVEFEVAKLLDAEIYKHEESSTRATAGTLLPEWLLETYEILNRWAEAGEDAVDYSKLDRIKAEFDVASAAFARLVRAERSSAVHQGVAVVVRQENKALASHASHREAGSLDAEREIAALKDALQQQRRQATLMDAELHQLRNARDDAENQLFDARAEIAASRSRRKEMARVIGNREEKVASLNRELEARYKELAMLERHVLRFSPIWWIRVAIRRLGRVRRRPAQ